MFDFEMRFMNSQMTKKEFTSSGPYLYLRSVLKIFWKLLYKHKSYPNMIKPLVIKNKIFIGT